MKVLIIANARYKGGLSGSDNIYLNFQKYWAMRSETTVEVWNMLRIDFRPFALCYLLRLALGLCRALFCREKYDFVYSASDFMMDSLPAYILKRKGNKWVAGFYLLADWKYTWKGVFFRKISPNKIIYKKTQEFVKPIIAQYADVICVTNESMFDIFPNQYCIPVHGGVDLTKTEMGGRDYKYDAVFVGRLHYTKGIENLIHIWDKVLSQKPDARLAVIGDGDTERHMLYKWLEGRANVTHFGFVGDERYDIYKLSRMVLYTTPPEYSHFSMGPVEAMACGCPMIAFEQAVMQHIFTHQHGVPAKKPIGTLLAKDNNDFAKQIMRLLDDKELYWELREEAYQWARTWDWEHRAKKVLLQIKEHVKIS